MKTKKCSGVGLGEVAKLHRSSNLFLELRFHALARLDRETIKFLLPSHVRMSGTIDSLSKLDMIEILVKEHLMSL